MDEASPYTKGTRSTFDEDDASDSEEYDDPQDFTWKLQFGESVYDDSILRIINIPNEYRRWTPIMFLLQVFTIVLVISINFVLQTLVISRVHMINVISDSDSLGKVFGPPLAQDGSCWKRENTMFPDFLTRAGTGPDEFTWDCSPLLPTLLSNVSWLDANNDTVWSAADDIEGLGSFYENKFGKAGNLTRTFDRCLEQIRDGKFRYVHRNQLSEAQRKSETKDFTEIPMDWMRAEQPILQLCNNVDKQLCGNLEIRGVLEILIPDAHTPGDRVEECRIMHDRCDNLFGELFLNYNDYAEATCGLMDSIWDSQKRVTEHTYEKAALYNPTEQDSVTHSTYVVFLALVLVIWWLAVLEELRRVLTWGMVLLMMEHNGNRVKALPDITTIESVSNATKSVIIIFIMIPRLGIIVALSFIGSQFLIGSDSYGVLILNGVVLSFIADIDEMMFAALMGQNAKDSIASTQAVSTHHNVWRGLINLCDLPAAPAGMLFVISMVALQMHLALQGPVGKYSLAVAYACLCHAEGPNCLSAQLLGGNPT